MSVIYRSTVGVISVFTSQLIYCIMFPSITRQEFKKPISSSNATLIGINNPWFVWYGLQITATAFPFTDS